MRSPLCVANDPVIFCDELRNLWRIFTSYVLAAQINFLCHVLTFLGFPRLFALTIFGQNLTLFDS